MERLSYLYSIKFGKAPEAATATQAALAAFQDEVAAAKNAADADKEAVASAAYQAVSAVKVLPPDIRAAFDAVAPTLGSLFRGLHRTEHATHWPEAVAVEQRLLQEDRLRQDAAIDAAIAAYKTAVLAETRMTSAHDAFYGYSRVASVVRRAEDARNQAFTALLAQHRDVKRKAEVRKAAALKAAATRASKNAKSKTTSATT
jgi:hypothetical protein